MMVSRLVGWTLALGLSLILAGAQGLPQQVPEGKTAAEYYEMGQLYKKAGWTEQSRDCLNRSIKADPRGVGKEAKVFLECYIPKYPVTPDAVQMNVMGYNQMAQNDLAGAEKTFQDCIKKYPKFEWPYGNLGMLYSQQGKQKEARQTLQKVLGMNPSYVNGWIHLAEACQKDNDMAGAKEAVARVLQLDPSNSAARRLQSQLKP